MRVYSVGERPYAVSSTGAFAGVAQLVRARGSYPRRPGFKSLHRHHSPSPREWSGSLRVNAPRPAVPVSWRVPGEAVTDARRA